MYDVYIYKNIVRLKHEKAIKYNKTQRQTLGQLNNRLTKLKYAVLQIGRPKTCSKKGKKKSEEQC